MILRTTDKPPDPRSTIVFGAAFISLIFGIAYTPAGFAGVDIELPPGLDIVSRLIPIWVFGLMWLIVGIWCMFVAFRHLRGVRPLAVLFAMNLLWWLSYTAAWVLEGFMGRSWIAAGLFFGLTCMTGALCRTRPDRDT